MRIVPVLVLAAMSLGLPGCDEEVNPGSGGMRTALLRVEAYVAWTKVRMCQGSDAFLGTVGPAFMASDSLPVLDGRRSLIIRGMDRWFADLLDARSCDEVFRAINHGEVPGACTEASLACDGNTLRECRFFGSAGLALATDCENYDLQCRAADCVPGECASASCDGDSLVSCDSRGYRRIFECGNLGLTCGFGAEGLQCIGKGEVCDIEEIRPRCDETSTLTWCLGGRVASVNCGNLTDGRRQCNQGWINENKDISPDEVLDMYLLKACGPASFECMDDVSICDGNLLQVCVDGVLEIVDCRDYGFATCGFDHGLGRPACTGFPS